VYNLAIIEALLKTYSEAVAVLDDKDKKLYGYWLETYSGPHIVKWLVDHENEPSTFRTIEYIDYMAKHFVEWVSNKE
jgi:hypothetical protein